MTIAAPEVDLTGLSDPQRPVSLLVGGVLVVVGVAGLTGFADGDVLGIGLELGEGLLLGAFGIPLWLGITAVVAGLLGIVMSFYGGAGTTFNKVAAGLVLPPVLLLAVVDYALAAGGVGWLVVGLVALLLAVGFVVVAFVLLRGNPLALVHPVVALLALLDWGLGLTALAPAGAAATLPTLGLLVVLAVVVGVVAFEGGSRLT